MNLKEIGILLFSLYIITVMLMAYKYYHARGSVFQISRALVFKYILRLLSLMTLLFLCYYTIISKQVTQSLENNKPKILVAISSNSSSLVWNNLREKVVEMSDNGDFRLVIFDEKQQKWNSVIPATNQESFINLIEHAQESTFLHPKTVFTESIPSIPGNDEFIIFTYKNKLWTNEESTSSKDSFFSKNVFVSWNQTPYVPLYLVILLLLFVFIDIVFSVKGLKI